MLKKKKKHIDWLGLSLVSLIHILAAYGAVAHFSWGGLLLGFILYIVTGLGITMGYHRYFTHKGFRASWVLDKILAIAGSLAMEGPVKKWVLEHRLHHACSDKADDPHSARDGGFFWSHLGWLFFKHDLTPAQVKMAPGLLRDVSREPFLNFISGPLVYLSMNLLFAIILFLLGGESWLYYGFFVRIVWTWHVTWAVNSVCHKFGYRSFDVDDDSRNNIIVGILAFGEGFHNNHHANPLSARHGLGPGEPDFTYMVIKGCEKIGLLKDIEI